MKNKKVLAYILGFLAALLVIGLVAQIFTGMIPLLFSTMLGAYIGNKIVTKITGEKPKEYHIFSKKDNSDTHK